MTSIAAVVATYNRPELLASRALSSIARQTRPPDFLIVVDDSDGDIRRANAAAVAGFKVGGVEVRYMENRRTPGASGAWNTALAHLLATEQATFVAILDDDDSWASSYLEQCEKAVSEQDLDMVAAGLIYHESGAPSGRPLDPSPGLDANELLVRNTHIQGSNLFVRLRKLLEAGGFDEALVSTTDRDVCIRLVDLGTVRYGVLAEHLVHHYADNDRPRLSTPGGDKKKAGLRYFYRKHRGRMSESQQAAFIERSRRLFDCDPTTEDLPPPHIASPQGCAVLNGCLNLVAGSVTSADVSQVSRLMASLVRKLGGRDDVALKVVLLENGSHEAAARDALRGAVSHASNQGLDVTLITLEQQAADAVAGVFAGVDAQLSGRKSIALSRTMLQHYLFLEAKPRPGAVVWVLDDDVVLEGLGYGPDGSVQSQDVDYVSAIKRLKVDGAGVVLCQVTGDPPLPFLSCIRTQLVDLYHNLHLLAHLRPEDHFPKLRDENRLSRLNWRDYYYDLSATDAGHLEFPFWYEPTGTDLSAGQAFEEMVSRLPGILSGIQVFRPLIRAESEDSVSDTHPSVNRGPATLVFDVQALREFPNAVPAMGGADTRRSDMVWSLLNRFVGVREVAQSPLPVRQVRGLIPDPVPDFDTLAQDIWGHALYSSLRDVFTQKAQGRSKNGKGAYGRGILPFDDDEVKWAVGLCQNYARERVNAFEMSFIRTMGLLSALRPFFRRNPVDAPAPWFLDLPEYAASADRLRNFIETLEPVYSDARLESFKQRTAAIDTGAIERFLRDLPEIVARHRASTPLPAEELRRAAESYVMARFRTGSLTCLGIGEEGVALTDGRLVYKYFHYWKSRNRERQIAFLQSLAGKLAGYKTLPALQEVRRDGDCVVAVYPHEAGSKYEGGELQGLLTLLRECRHAGIACRNIHPGNLLATADGLQFIDYGADVVPFNDAEFEQMCRRAFLTYRFPFRSDLKRLMTRALTDAGLPELTGLEQFRNAVDPRGLDTLYYRPMVQLVAASQPESVLDYGCGDGRLAEALSQQGINVTGYDPDAASIATCLEYGSTVAYGGQDLLTRLLAVSARFDAVVCGRVLCTIADKAEFEAVLGNLRLLVADSGTAFVAVCNPFYLQTTSTELAEKHLPEKASYEDTFPYAKTVAVNGNRRTEVHRSWAAYRRAFTKAGFRTEEAREFDGTDTGALLPASDHLVFRLRPSPANEPRVSLLIKTCFMEWPVIERLVRHQVGLLGHPVKFVEKVVVVDTREGPFLRQYCQPNPEAHRIAMQRLLRDGVVDRVVYAPQEADVISETYRKWFGAESAETHSANGQQLFATLFGFDSCTGDYVLQLDSDLLVARTDENHNYLAEMADVLRHDDKALFVPLSICRPEPKDYTSEGPDGDRRVEVRGCLFDRRRLQSVLPVPNELEDGRFTLAWHRAFDSFITSSDYRCYRGGDPRTAFIHVPNDRKVDIDGWLEILGAVERGHVPAAQMERVELAGSLADWAGPKRREPFVFVVCGRNVEPGRFKRCFQSLIAQRSGDWGAVIVDDASTNGFGDYAAMLTANYSHRITLIRNETRRGTLYNTWKAVNRFCADPETVIITLDADDALIGEDVLDRVRSEYDGGADVTVGSMLRLDKEASYPVNFGNPRRWDSNVWQHLRTFRKLLFDAIAVEDLQIDGEWIDPATDWAFMVPIVEMAASPRYIPDSLYLYEPAVPKDNESRCERDAVIACILDKSPYSKLL